MLYGVRNEKNKRSGIYLHDWYDSDGSTECINYHSGPGWFRLVYLVNHQNCASATKVL